MLSCVQDVVGGVVLHSNDECTDEGSLEKSAGCIGIEDRGHTIGHSRVRV